MPRGFSRLACAVLAASCIASVPMLIERAAQAQQPTQGAPDDPALLPEQTLGRRFTVKAEDMPRPYSGAVVSNRSLTLPYEGQVPRVPEGFTATLFASGLAHPRRLLVLPNGDVLVAEQKVGYLTLLRDQDGDGKADWIERHAPGRGAVEIKAADIPPEQRRPSRSVVGEEMVTKKGVFGIVQGHANRHLAIEPKTGALFVGVGSSGNLGVEPEVKATIQRFEANGSGQTTFASGMRNPTALAFHPDTGDLYAVVQERDGLGNELVPDFFARVEKGAFYGWPYSYIGQNPQPGFAQMRPDKVQAAVKPDLLFQPHSSLLDLVFYTGDQFPAEYRGDAFVALKGSWNRSEPTGYKIVRVPFKDGRPQGWYENFAAGFWASGVHRAEVWGRPTALAIMKDGSLLVADDTGGTIWRISYTGPKRQSSDGPATTSGTTAR